MGTRALILKNGKKWVFTHWDGYPNNLGKLLCRIRGKSESAKLRILHEEHNVDRYYNYHGGEATIATNRQKPFKRLTYKKFYSTRNTNWGFIYTYNITRSGIFYTKEFSSEKEIIKTNLSNAKWKKLC